MGVTTYLIWVGLLTLPTSKNPLRVLLLVRIILHVVLSTSLFVDFVTETGKHSLDRTRQLRKGEYRVCFRIRLKQKSCRALEERPLQELVVNICWSQNQGDCNDHSILMFQGSPFSGATKHILECRGLPSRESDTRDRKNSSRLWSKSERQGHCARSSASYSSCHGLTNLVLSKAGPKSRP